MSEHSAEIRRIVVGRDGSGRAVVLFDGPTPNSAERPALHLTSHLMWSTDSRPARDGHSQDHAQRDVGVVPPAGGSVFRVVEFHPIDDQKVQALPLDFMARSFPHAGASEAMAPRHPFMHRTETTDYAIVLSGEIDMLLDDSEVHLKAGDVIVQQATNHAWVNRSRAPCRMAFVLIDARHLTQQVGG